ncbi:bifunctional protein GlmU [Candidatus Caldarchaeum subterraneum]|uniref:Bifunctional protein GlmU n=1 Tax=Caldiarchaeum subterraneum TaxID=311458 RepID=E6N8M6_CALS0|nr:bifunctional protein GlmU [Candidatus Caldarchaeum subterraneum]BAJ51350.1 bifunctional protein GlmU [Candidatus Caldarchaeum subterraneum]
MLKAVVFAAGYGKRLRPLTINRPKHVLPVAGKPLIRWVVEALSTAGIDDVGVLVGYHGHDAVEALKNLHRPRLTFIEQKKLLGTGQALKECREFLEGEDVFLVVYGDVTVNDMVLRRLLGFWREGGFDSVLAAVELEESKRFGSIKLDGERLVKIEEKTGAGKIVNAGIYIFSKNIFKALEMVGFSERGEIELTDAVNQLAAQGHIVGVKVFDRSWWFDVGLPADYLRVNHVYLSNFLGEAISIDEGTVLGEDVELNGPVMVEEGCVIESGSVLEGPCYICQGSFIGRRSRVAGSVVLEKCFLGPGSHLVNSVLGEGSVFSEGVEVLSGGFPAYVSEPGFRAEKRLKIV